MALKAKQKRKPSFPFDQAKQLINILI